MRSALSVFYTSIRFKQLRPAHIAQTVWHPPFCFMESIFKISGVSLLLNLSSLAFLCHGVFKGWWNVHGKSVRIKPMYIVDSIRVNLRLNGYICELLYQQKPNMRFQKSV